MNLHSRRPVDSCRKPLATLAVGLLSGISTCIGATAAEMLPNPLSFADGRFVLDAQANSRMESRDNNNDFDSHSTYPTDSTWVTTRLRLGALIKPTPWFKVYAQGQDIREFWGLRPKKVGSFGADGNDTFDLLQGWTELGDEARGTSLRVGRQPFNYGDQRLLGNPQWLNSTRAWDAVRLRQAGQSWKFDLFSGSPVTFIDNQFNRSDLFNASQSRDAIDSGAYFSSTKAIPTQSATDFYLINQNANKVAAAAGAPVGRTGPVNVWTVGTRMKGDLTQLARWDYDLEMAAQFGSVTGLEHRAFAGHWGGGYNFEQDWQPRLGVQFNYASGDGNPKDGKSGTFQNYFPGNHALYGFMDTTAWMNMQQVQLNYSMKPTTKLKMGLDYMATWNATSHDAWFAANTSGVVRPLNALAVAADPFRGHEVDFNTWYTVNRNLTLQMGYSLFLPGSYLRDTGASDTAHFGYAQVTLQF